MKMFNQIKENLKKLGIDCYGDSNIEFSKIKVIVPLSGGKDSQACLKLAIEQFDSNEVLALFCDTKFEHELTYQHIESVCKKYNVNLVTLNAGSVEGKIIKYKRFPGGGARHCTDELKIRPGKYFYKITQEVKKQQGIFSEVQVWYGMRFDESQERAQRYKEKINTETYPPHEVMPKKYPKYLYKLGVTFKLPILDWSTEEVLDFLVGEENILYSKGFDRVGCFPCLAGGEKHQKKAFDFDETGKKHFEIVVQLAKECGRTVFRTKKMQKYNPDESGSGCSICSI